MCCKHTQIGCFFRCVVNPITKMHSGKGSEIYKDFNAQIWNGEEDKGT